MRVHVFNGPILSSFRFPIVSFVSLIFLFSFFYFSYFYLILIFFFHFLSIIHLIFIFPYCFYVASIFFYVRFRLCKLLFNVGFFLLSIYLCFIYNFLKSIHVEFIS